MELKVTCWGRAFFLHSLAGNNKLIASESAESFAFSRLFVEMAKDLENGPVKAEDVKATVQPDDWTSVLLLSGAETGDPWGNDPI